MAELYRHTDEDGRALLARIEEKMTGQTWEDVPDERRLALWTVLERVEYAIRMTSGAMQVRADFPDLERTFPLAEWIRSEQRGCGKVYRRVVVVVEDWEEVEGG